VAAGSGHGRRDDARQINQASPEGMQKPGCAPDQSRARPAGNGVLPTSHRPTSRRLQARLAATADRQGFRTWGFDATQAAFLYTGRRKRFPYHGDERVATYISEVSGKHWTEGRIRGLRAALGPMLAPPRRPAKPPKEYPARRPIYIAEECLEEDQE
jgi:hypothetical protein